MFYKKKIKKTINHHINIKLISTYRLLVYNIIMAFINTVTNICKMCKPDAINIIKKPTTDPINFR